MYKVLILEDDADIAALHSHFISRDKRFRVLGCIPTLKQAREALAITAVDLLIVDNYLPDGVGVDVFSSLQQLDKCPEAILVTAANDADTVQKALRHGAFDYLIKPLDYTRLMKSLDKFCEVQKTLAQSNQFAQGDLDQLFHHDSSGLKRLATDEHTLRQIVDQFCHSHIEMNVSTIAEIFGISKSTARRYLDKAVEQGDLDAFLAHGKVGRPTRIYRRPS
ncbi:response regulator [Vibrio sp. YMD68]|uniref:response regulator n=1 Tax=Vibrio sp. YMD68 TaxID=3042300 RepID=UPI00249AEF7A|nr:response regulator [Vibrio sp. YMD68]WGW01013.1 response regulator [Vibrio sp. YMD68]